MNESSEPADDPEPAAAAPAAPRSILIVDDEASARDTLGALLHREGHALSFAASAAEALAALERAPVDLILCDVMMPEVDGFTLCRRLHDDARWRYIPVILVTALDARGDMLRGIAAGADEFLSKPVDKVVLRARVRVMLRIKEHYDELCAHPAPHADPQALLRARIDNAVTAARLSPREREVLELLLVGRTNDEIGVALDIAARTAKFHVANVLSKLGADSRSDLLRIFL